MASSDKLQCVSQFFANFSIVIGLSELFNFSDKIIWQGACRLVDSLGLQKTVLMNDETLSHYCDVLEKYLRIVLLAFGLDHEASDALGTLAVAGLSQVGLMKAKFLSFLSLDLDSETCPY